jgi:hypothetical protein
MDSQNLSKNLKPISKLLKESFEIYSSKIKTLLGIAALPVGFSFFFWVLKYFLSNTSVKYSLWFSVLELISSLGTFFLWLLAIPSLIYSLKENNGIKDSFKRGLKMLLPYFWVWFLFDVIVAGAFLIFIIPGILFFIWFSLAIFVLIFEEKKGFDALFKSKHLVEGTFLEILARFLVVFSLILIVGLSLMFISTYLGVKNPQIANRIMEPLAYFFQLFVIPFIFVYCFLIYNDLKEIKIELPYKQPKIILKIIYALSGILGTLILGLVIGIYFLNVFWGRDIPPIDDSDLWLPKIEISKEENAFYIFEKAVEKMYLPSEKIDLFAKMVEGKKWDNAFAEELIKNNEEVFQLFEEAIKLPYFQLPSFEDPKKVEPTTNIPIDLLSLRNIARLNIIKARYLLMNKGEKEAIDLILKTIKMGQMIENSPRQPPITYLAGSAIKKEGLDVLRTMIPYLTLPQEALKDYIVQLEEFKANEEGLLNALKMEYAVFTKAKQEIDDAFRGLSKKKLEELQSEIFASKELRFEPIKLNYLYKPNQTQKLFAESYRNLIENANKDCYEAKELKRLTPCCSTIKMLVTENIVGRILHDISLSAEGEFINQKCIEDASIDATQLLLALKAYKMENEKLPTSLNELSPKYILQIPKDPFDGKPMKYFSEKKIIYSIGQDLKDSGGDEKEDLVFKIEF